MGLLVVKNPPFSSACRWPPCLLLYGQGYVVYRITFFSPSTSQSPPSKSASDSLIFSFFEHIELPKRFRPSPPVCNQQNCPFRYPSLFSHVSDANERGRSQFQSMHSLMNQIKHPVPLLYNILACWPWPGLLIVVVQW